MIYFTHFIYKLLYEKNSEVVSAAVNIATVNAQPMPGKVIKMKKYGETYVKMPDGKDRLFRNDETDSLAVRQRYLQGWGSKQYLPSLKRFPKSLKRFENREDVKDALLRNRADSITLGFRPDTIFMIARWSETQKLFFFVILDKRDHELLIGVTEHSLALPATQYAILVLKGYASLEDLPSAINFIFVNKSQVRETRENFARSRFEAKFFNILPRVNNFIYDINKIKEVSTGKELGEYEYMFPYTGFNRKKVIRDIFKWKFDIPRQRNAMEIRRNANQAGISIVGNNYNEDEEPLDVRRDRLRRNNEIEQSLDTYYREIFNTNNNDDMIIELDSIATAGARHQISLAGLPEPQSDGYIHVEDEHLNSYDIQHPERMFRGVYEPDDNGQLSCYVINGFFYPFFINNLTEVQLMQGEYGFYYCPSDRTVGIRYKKPVVNREDNNNRSGDGQGGNRRNNQNPEDRPNRIVHKYIYLNVLNDMQGNMEPTTVDFYSSSYLHLGRLNYDRADINRKEQVSINLSFFQSVWERRDRNPMQINN